MKYMFYVPEGQRVKIHNYNRIPNFDRNTKLHAHLLNDTCNHSINMYIKASFIFIFQQDHYIENYNSTAYIVI